MFLLNSTDFQSVLNSFDNCLHKRITVVKFWKHFFSIPFLLDEIRTLKDFDVLRSEWERNVENDGDSTDSQFWLFCKDSENSVAIQITEHLKGCYHAFVSITEYSPIFLNFALIKHSWLVN